MCRLANEFNWSMFEEEFEKLYNENNGRPALPTSILVVLHFLKYNYNYSDEGVVE